MKGINSKIIEHIATSDSEVATVDMIGYLICIYHNIYPTYLPLPEIESEAVRIGLIKTENQKASFLIPLYTADKNEELEEKWKWIIKEYIPLFKEVDKSSSPKEVVPRMKKLFYENPDIRVDEIIGASKMYIRNTNNKYIREARYFIYKGVGTDKVSDLLTWIEKYRIATTSNTEGRAISRTMQ